MNQFMIQDIRNIWVIVLCESWINYFIIYPIYPNLYSTPCYHTLSTITKET